jgi:hypothetical protein
MTTLVFQSGLIMGRGVISWRNLVAGAVTFAILGAYYFVSMSELPPEWHVHPPSYNLLQIAGFAAFFIGIGRYALLPRSFGWAVCAAAGACVVWITDYPWFCWAVATAIIWLASVSIFRVLDRGDFKRHAFVVLFLSTLAGAAVAEAWVGREGMFQAALETLSDNTAHVRDEFAPLVTPMRSRQIFQPGWGLITIFVVSVTSLFGSRPLGAKLFFAVSLGLVICFLRVPLVSNFLDGRFPTDLAAMCGVPMPLRITPVIASFMAMAGVVWASTLSGIGRRSWLAIGSLLAALVLWSGFQTIPFLRHTREMTGTAYSTERNLRPENAMLDAYAYLLLHVPSYFSHGKTDPLLESRLLDDSGKVLVGPVEDAILMEGHGVREIRMTTSPMPNSMTWFSAGPIITVEPQEHVLLRFQFDPSQNYSGYFIVEAEHSYREYHLPDSGMASAFGVGGSRTSVLSLWNTGTTPEHYKFSLSTEPGNDIPHSGGLFAILYVSHLNASALPISLESFIPYRARVTSAQGGTLETFRAYMPGYRATVDGNDVPVAESREHLDSVQVPPGTHEVELRFVGSGRLRLAAAASGIGWICLIAYCAIGASLQRRLGIG